MLLVCALTRILGALAAHLAAQLFLPEQARVGQALVEVSAEAGLKHEVQVGGIVSGAAQVHDTRHPERGAAGVRAGPGGTVRRGRWLCCPAPRCMLTRAP